MGRESLPSSPTSRALRILVVEDHPDTRDMLTRVLRSHTVRAVGTVAAALEAAQAEAFDLVVSDLGLPDASGLELMRQLNERYGLRGIALTGFGMEEDLEKGRDVGFVEHMTKPVDLKALRVAVERVVG